MTPRPPLESATSCWSCGHRIDASDHYCRACGQGQGDYLPWYYHPLWIALLTVTALGPFTLPLVWRTPRLDRSGKWVASVAIVAVTAWVGWQFMIAIREIGRVLVSV